MENNHRHSEWSWAIHSQLFDSTNRSIVSPSQSSHFRGAVSIRQLVPYCFQSFSNGRIKAPLKDDDKFGSTSFSLLQFQMEALECKGVVEGQATTHRGCIVRCGFRGSRKFIFTLTFVDTEYVASAGQIGEIEERRGKDLKASKFLVNPLVFCVFPHDYY